MSTSLKNDFFFIRSVRLMCRSSLDKKFSQSNALNFLFCCLLRLSFFRLLIISYMNGILAATQVLVLCTAAGEVTASISSSSSSSSIFLHYETTLLLNDVLLLHS